MLISGGAGLWRSLGGGAAAHEVPQQNEKTFLPAGFCEGIAERWHLSGPKLLVLVSLSVT